MEVLAQQLTSARKWDEVERKRRKYLVLRTVLWVPGLLIAALGVRFLVALFEPSEVSDDSANVAVTVIGLIFLLLGYWLITVVNRFAHKRYGRVCKQLLVPELMAKLPQRAQANFSYEAKSKVDERELSAIPMFDRYKGGIFKGEDALTANMADRTIRYEEVTLRRHGEDSWLFQYYSWLDWFLFGLVDFMGWKFKGGLLRVTFHDASVAGATTFHTRWSPARRCIRARGRRLKVGNPAFRRSFRIRSTEPGLAKEQLTDGFADSFVALRKRFPRRFMAVCLQDDTVAIAIRGFDLFEVKGLRKPDPSTMQRIYAELDMILNAATELAPPERVTR